MKVRLWLLVMNCLVAVCTVAQVQLNVAPSVSKTSVCRNATIQLAANAIGGIAPYSFIWSGTNLQNNTSDNTSAIITTNKLVDSLQYTVKVIDGNGDSAEASVMVYVKDIAVNAGNDTIIGCGTAAILKATTQGSITGQQLQWTGPVNDTSSVLPSATEGLYVVMVSNSTPCVVTDTVNVNLPIDHQVVGFKLVPGIYVDSTAWTIYLRCGDTGQTRTNFRNESSITTGWTWTWTTSSGGLGANTDFSNTFHVIGPDTIALQGDSAGCSLSSSHIVTVRNCVTSINTVFIENTIKIYPNPSYGKIILSMAEDNAQLKIELLNLQGQLLYTEQLSNQSSFKKELDFSTVAKGMYLLKVSAENDVNVQRLLIE